MDALHDNACPHIVICVHSFFAKRTLSVLDHWAYFSYPAPLDFFFIPALIESWNAYCLYICRKFNNVGHRRFERLWTKHSLTDSSSLTNVVKILLWLMDISLKDNIDFIFVSLVSFYFMWAFAEPFWRTLYNIKRYLDIHSCTLFN